MTTNSDVGGQTLPGGTDSVARLRGLAMGLMAGARADRITQLLENLSPLPPYTHLRAPETGLVQVRGRTGGTGDAFNLGEMPVTRCSVSLADGLTGHAYVAGRNSRTAEFAALIDALLQSENDRPAVLEKVIEPLAAERAARRETDARKAAATRVDFFTMLRGED